MHFTRVSFAIMIHRFDDELLPPQELPGVSEDIGDMDLPRASSPSSLENCLTTLGIAQPNNWDGFIAICEWIVQDV